MKCLVTGGAGFIGSHLCERLLALGHEVVAFDNLECGREDNFKPFINHPNFSFIQGDIRSPDHLKIAFEGVEWVFHLAALASIVPSIEQPEDYYHTNVTGTFNVLQAAKEAKVKRFVYAASSSCYGLVEQFPTPESAPIRTEYPYALTKFLGEELVLHWAQVYKMPALSLRLFNVFGPRSRTDGTYGAVFGVFLAQKLKNKPFTVVGDGTQTRDFTYVTDVVDAFITAASSEEVGKAYNVGSGGDYSVNRLVDLLGGEKIHIPKRPGEPDRTFADTSKIQKELGWKPQVSFEKGVEQVVENIDYWREAPVWDPKSIEIATEKWFNYLGETNELST